MNLHYVKIILAGLATEVLAIATLVLIVALLGPGERAADQAFAESIGYWVGPIAGFVFCLAAGFWVAKSAGTLRIQHGLLVGVVAAAIDVVLLMASSPPFSMVFVVSNIGRIVAGTLGGWLALHLSDRA